MYIYNTYMHTYIYIHIQIYILFCNMVTSRLSFMQLNSCNSYPCNSKHHLKRTNSSVLAEFTSKPLQENSFNSNSHNSKNHLNRTNFWVPWTYFSSCNSNFGFGVQFFHLSIFYCSKFKCFNSNAIIFECFEIFKFV